MLGTGSVYHGAQGRAVSRAIGGWGFQIGDQGSGARIGRDLLEETLLAHDGIRNGSPLTDEHAGRLQRQPAGRWSSSPPPPSPATSAASRRMVFEHAARGDAVARWIVDRAVADVEASLGVLDLDASDAAVPARRAGAGFYAPRLSAAIGRCCGRRCSDALGGAVRMAARLFAPRGGGDELTSADQHLRRR